MDHAATLQTNRARGKRSIQRNVTRLVLLRDGATNLTDRDPRVIILFSPGDNRS